MLRTPAILLFLTSLASADPEVFGQIVDSETRDGGVIEFSFLRLKNSEDLDGQPVPVKTDRTGRFSLKLPPGNYRIGDIRKPSEKDKRFFEANYSRDLIEVGGDQMYDVGVIRLEKTGTFVTGTVKRGGKPAAGVTVEVFLPGAGMPTGQTALSDSKGVYELQMPDVKGPQAVAVRVEEKEGNTFGSAAVDLWKSATIDLDLPAQYCELLVDLTTAGETWIYLHPARDPAPYILNRAARTAKVAIAGLAPGAWTVTAVSDGATVSADVTLPSATPLPISFPVKPRCRLDGRIAISGLPADGNLPGMAVIARPAGEGPAGYLWAPLGRDGRFAFPGLAAGKYELSVASGTVFDAMRYFGVRRSAIVQGVLELSASRTVELNAKAADFLK